ncbi:hypothetical protein KKH86_03950 [Patescibacteria group bacterium]|nr:hypothetical protein [Patescibacteria group bacterium]
MSEKFKGEVPPQEQTAPVENEKQNPFDTEIESDKPYTFEKEDWPEIYNIVGPGSKNRGPRQFQKGKTPEWVEVTLRQRGSSDDSSSDWIDVHINNGKIVFARYHSGGCPLYKAGPHRPIANVDDLNYLIFEIESTEKE